MFHLWRNKRRIASFTAKCPYENIHTGIISITHTEKEVKQQMTRDNAFYDYGLILSTKILKKIAEKLTEKEHTENDPYTIEDTAEYFDNCLSSVSDFTGNAFKIDAQGNADEDEDTIYYSDDSIYYVPFKKEPTLLKAAYKNIDEIVDELKSSNIAQYLPDDFDYKEHLYFINGFYWG